MEPVILAACIETAGTVFASIVAAIIATWYGKRWKSQERLEHQLNTARNDIEFLLEVEKHYIAATRSVKEVLGKIATRKAVESSGYHWSGQHTPGRVKLNTRS